MKIYPTVETVYFIYLFLVKAIERSHNFKFLPTTSTVSHRFVANFVDWALEENEC